MIERSARQPATAEQPVVFVVDDDESVREALRSLFRSVSLRVETFGSAADFLRSELPEVASCLVLDVRLPGVSGLDFQAELAKANIHIPVIFMTGHGDIPMSVQAMKAGAVDFLTKPFRDQDMLDAVAAALCFTSIEALVSDDPMASGKELHQNAAALLEPKRLERSGAMAFIEQVFKQRSLLIHGDLRSGQNEVRAKARMLASSVLRAAIAVQEFDRAMQMLDEQYNLLEDPFIEQLALHEDTKQLIFRRGPLVFSSLQPRQG